MRNVFTFLLSLALFLAPVAAADELPVITLDEALESAEASSISLQQARILLEQTMRNQNAVMTTFMPDLTLTAGLSTGADFPGNRTLGALPSGGVGMVSSNTTEFSGLNVSAGLSASFSFNGTMITDAETRRIAKEGASLTYASSYRQVNNSITDTYWTLAAYKASEDTARLSLENAQTSYQSAQEMYDAGLADELTLREAELMVQQAEIQVQTSADTYARSMSAFKNATGIEEDFVTEPIPETVFLSFPSPEEIYADYADATLDIRTARNSLLSAQNGLNTANIASYVPIITVGVNYNYAGGAGANNSWDYNHQTHGLTGSVNLSLPIDAMIPGSSEDMQRKDAKDAVSIASLSLKNAQDTLLEDIRQSVMTIEQNQKTIEMERTRLETEEKTFALAQESFEAGLMTAADLNTRRNSLLSAQLSLLTAELNQLVASYDLSYKLGISLEDLQNQYGTTGDND